VADDLFRILPQYIGEVCERESTVVSNLPALTVQQLAVRIDHARLMHGREYAIRYGLLLWCFCDVEQHFCPVVFIHDIG
jgi:hypothetical protein